MIVAKLEAEKEHMLESVQRIVKGTTSIANSATEYSALDETQRQLFASTEYYPNTPVSHAQPSAEISAALTHQKPETTNETQSASSFNPSWEIKVIEECAGTEQQRGAVRRPFDTAPVSSEIPYQQPVPLEGTMPRLAVYAHSSTVYFNDKPLRMTATSDWLFDPSLTPEFAQVKATSPELSQVKARPVGMFACTFLCCVHQ
jgi:hypothetical protein